MRFIEVTLSKFIIKIMIKLFSHRKRYNETICGDMQMKTLHIYSIIREKETEFFCTKIIFITQIE